ncbi:MAG: NAD-dependent epimerase/dehydratase family protein [Kiritimatiellae bacterium]|nr:NAD-dependent epimerase/dehydratase family protein [Kiritimatiellia bacterium]
MRPLAIRVLVTGGAGFIGSELVRCLADGDADVVIVDNLVNGKRENVEEVLSDRVRLEAADIRDSDRVPPLMKGVDTIFHLACLGVRHSIHSPFKNHEVNATATLRLLMWARAAGVRRFVYVSSSEVYGSVDSRPPMSEYHHTYPMTVYGASKLAGECYARAFHRTYGYDTVVVRPFNTYGPKCHHEGDSGEVIPKFMLRCMAGKPMVIFGDGEQTRDFTYVTDVARGILEIGLSEQAVGLTVNLGSGTAVSINHLAREVADVVGRRDARVEHDEPRPGDVRCLCADVTRLRSLMGFSPAVDLKRGLRLLQKWYEAQDIPPDELLRAETVHNWEAPA